MFSKWSTLVIHCMRAMILVMRLGHHLGAPTNASSASAFVLFSFLLCTLYVIKHACLLGSPGARQAESWYKEYMHLLYAPTNPASDAILFLLMISRSLLRWRKILSLCNDSFEDVKKIDLEGCNSVAQWHNF